MRSSWQSETGHLACNWFEVGQRAESNPPWLQELSELHGSYLPSVPDFASHSPFGGPSWFQPHIADRDWENRSL